MKLYIDGDGCPVIDLALKIAKQYKIESIIICDFAHVIQKKDAKTIVVSTGADSVDFKLVSLVNKGDIVITQDYGLAAMVLSKQAVVINQNGMVYDEYNIEQLLQSRHLVKKIIRSGGRVKGPKKRTKEQDCEFRINFEKLLQSITK